MGAGEDVADEEGYCLFKFMDVFRVEVVLAPGWGRAFRCISLFLGCASLVWLKLSTGLVEGLPRITCRRIICMIRLVIHESNLFSTRCYMF